MLLRPDNRALLLLVILPQWLCSTLMPGPCELCCGLETYCSPKLQLHLYMLRLHFYCLFIFRATTGSSGLTTGSAPRNHYWWAQEIHGILGIKLMQAACKVNAYPLWYHSDTSINFLMSVTCFSCYFGLAIDSMDQCSPRELQSITTKLEQC